MSVRIPIAPMQTSDEPRLQTDGLAVASWPRGRLGEASLHWIGDSRTIAVGVIALAASMVTAAWITAANSSYVVMVWAALLAGIGIASVETDADRRTSFSLLVWALTIRLVVLTSFFALAAREGGPFLGADSSQYYYGSVELAGQNLVLPTWPVIYFGSYDVGQYYLFGAALRFADADLFGLQMLNCALTAVAVPFAFGISRLVVPRGAIWVALVAALHPSLIGLSAIDLLKDPSIVCGVLGLMWVLLRLSRAERTAVVLALAAVALPLATYLRLSRFYVFAYIEAALVIAVAISFAARRRPFHRPLALALVVVVFTAVETVPMRALWPPTPLMFVAMAGHTLNTSAMRWSAPGLFERSRQRQRGPTGREADETSGTGIVNLAVNAFRRTFGPYPWVLPQGGSFRRLQDGQFYLFPGMFLWYAVLPLVVIGFARIGMGQWRALPQPFAAMLLWAFSLVYIAQYLLINLSYRQREVMLPILLVFGWLGLEWVQSRPRRLVRNCYLFYGAAITALAVLHVTVRALMSST